MNSVTYPEQPNYFWHWMFLLLPIGMLFYFFPKSTPAPFRVPNGNADWFLVLKMPEVPTIDSEMVGAARQQFDGWLDAMNRAGYQPMLFSEVQNRRRQGLGLPEKAVVLVFDPGYRATYEALNPILEKRRVPALWITHADPLAEGDYRYVSRHLAKTMPSSGLWDVALYQDPGTEFVLTADAKNPASDPFSWVANSNWRARNWLSENDGFHRLIVQSNWTAQDLLDQLNVEVPIGAPTQLFVKRVNGRLKALNASVGSGQASQTFDLVADGDRRVTTVFWPSTEGQKDFSVDLNVRKVEGELWLFLRWDEIKKQGLRVGITPDLLVVEHQQQTRHRKLAVRPFQWPQDGRVSCNVTWIHGNLKIQMNGQELVDIVPTLPPFYPQSRFGLTVFSQVRGSAEASGLNVLFTPLSNDLVRVLQSIAAN